MPATLLKQGRVRAYINSHGLRVKQEFIDSLEDHLRMMLGRAMYVVGMDERKTLNEKDIQYTVPRSG